MANRRAPSANGGDSGRTAASDGVAPLVGEGGQDRVAVADGGSSGGRRRRWQMEAALQGRMRPW